MAERKPMEPVGWTSVGAIRITEHCRPGMAQVWIAPTPNQIAQEGEVPVALYTADRIRSGIEAVRAEYPIARDGNLASSAHHALDALRARMGIEPDAQTEEVNHG